MDSYAKGIRLIITLLCLWLMGCDEQPLNSPYPIEALKENIFYASFAEQPKTLDPARSYSSNEYQFIAQVYEPLLQYHYLKRPYTLVPLTTMSMPKIIYYDKSGKKLHKHTSPKKIAKSVYQITLKPKIYYQQHPAFAKDKKGQYRYHDLTEDALDDANINTLSDFEFTGSRELIAADYVYQIKRLANPAIQSPILGLMKNYILGLNQLNKTLQKVYQKKMAKDDDASYFDIRPYSISGVRVTGRYSFEITIKGVYPQFIYWLAMPFFSPFPWEADVFYAQPDMDDRNISADWYPVGTGPYMMVENNPNREIVLVKNPNFHQEYFPESGDEKTNVAIKEDAGKRLPFIEKAIYSLEKESIPRWNKFLQGYYDSSGISADSFDQAINMSVEGGPQLSEMMKERNIRLYTSTGASIFYIGFNMLDDIVGGDSIRAKKTTLCHIYCP